MTTIRRQLMRRRIGIVRHRRDQRVLAAWIDDACGPDGVTRRPRPNSRPRDRDRDEVMTDALFHMAAAIRLAAYFALRPRPIDRRMIPYAGRETTYR
jgi:hypothetical protein